MIRLMLFFLVPALELYLLVKIGGVVGALNVVLWVFVSAGLGIWVMRSRGQAALGKVQAEISAGQRPQESMLHGLLLFFAGVLLILPGFLTDAAGLLLLLPPVRRLCIDRLLRYLAAQQSQAASGQRGPSGSFFYFRTMGGSVDLGPPEDPRRTTIIDCTPTEVSSHSFPGAEEAGGGKHGRAAPGSPESEEPRVFDCEAEVVHTTAAAPDDAENKGSRSGKP